MKLFFRLFGICLLLGCAPAVWSQTAGLKIDRVDIKYVGPASVSEQFIRSNIRLKAGDFYIASASEADIRSLYATGQFYNIRVSLDQASDGGVVLTYIVQARPRLTEIKIDGNKKLSASKIRKKITAKVGQPLDEQKLFTDSQEIQKLYEKYGYAGTRVKYVVDVDENAGRGTATFQITEQPKVKIVKVEFIGAAAFSQRELRKQLKTRQRWMFSWLTGSDVYKEDQFADDQDALVEYYRSHGYLDFEIKDVKLEHPTPKTMDIRFFIFEGRQYKVGSVKFTGNKIFNDAQLRQGLQYVHDFERERGKLGPHGLPMDAGDIFTPDGLDKDVTAVEDFYGSKGYINVKQGPALQVLRVPNVDTGTMDLEFQIDEGHKYYVERIDIHGNVKTKDKVIRRELAISPGEVFDMVRVKISKQRLEGLQYFDKVDMNPEPTDPPIAGRQNLVVDVEEQNTGKLMLGAGFSSVDSVVGFIEIEQANFDLFHPPYFTGGGQRARLFIQLGSQRQDYELLFSEPWFMNRKLRLDVDLYRHQWDFESPNNIFNETRTGASVSLTRALWSDFLMGTIGYNIEDVGISLNGGWHGDELVPSPIFPYPLIPILPNVPSAILEQNGDHLFHHFTASLAYDTRNSIELPNGGQRTEFDPEFVTGDSTYYKLELKTEWFFRGLYKSHVIELSGRAGIADGLGTEDVPFYDRYYLGGLYNLRGFKYRNIGPRDPLFGIQPLLPNEPVGGDSYWFGSVDYYIPIIQKEGGVSLRFDLFYDAGSVSTQPYSFSGSVSDDYGVGLLLNIPHLGPLQLYYGIPISHDQFNSGAGKFQFGFGYSREF
ncbi:MAG TPA: outer membrane protein assembly factor BamA [Candidatus Limnocylindrales bacterium]|nr:outer membrane protein assembly factor BamA [Candidatus Limnocylindrales bacterium]